MKRTCAILLLTISACGNPPTLKKICHKAVLDSSIPWAKVIEREAKINEIDPHTFAALIKTESSFNPRAVSNRNAHGLTQLRPYAQKKTGVRNPYDPIESIKGGARWLYLGKKELAEKGKSTDESTLLAWYYCGIKNLLKNPDCGRDYANTVQKNKEA